jgi:hypothetical protein
MGGRFKSDTICMRTTLRWLSVCCRSALPWARACVLRHWAFVVTIAVALVMQDAMAAERILAFDIPAQPLDSALDAFSTATGGVAVYNSNLTVGLQSNGLRGQLTPSEALQLLLKGTGLVGEYTGQNAFVVIPGARQSAAVNSAPAIAQAALLRQNADERRYSGLLQESVARALCLQPETRAGGYRAAISFWINASGDLVRPTLLSSTGDDRRDAAISAAVARVSLGEPPPARMPQPFTMIVLPQTNSVVLCPPGESRRAPQ